jgi:hypothetical protein
MSGVISAGAHLFFWPGDPIVRTFCSAIRRVAGIVNKFAFFMAGWTLVGVGICIKGIPTIGAFPAGHFLFSLYVSGLYSDPLSFTPQHRQMDDAWPFRGPS